MVTQALADEGIQRLRGIALPSGGWGYHAGGQFFAVPTALALLALAPRSTAPKPPSIDGSGVVESSLRSLLSCQLRSGLFSATSYDAVESWATAPAILALLAHGHRDRAETAAEALSRWYAPPDAPNRETRELFHELLKIDFAIRGWPWQAGESFATVEPTSLAMLALHASRTPPAEPRLTEGMKYLADRACPSGGWNYGNPYFYDARLAPITLPTAKAVLALAVCGGDTRDAPLSSGAATLKRLLSGNPSRKANAWGTLAFAALDSPAEAAHYAAAAVDSSDGRGPWIGGADEIALGILAVRAAIHDVPACLRRVSS
jgi:hypothetical protein